ncbi:MAG: hypothetical protein IJK66_05350 [Bacilli bacterium]|nr:hypothetical protein [Bacilli bacterium]
MEKYYHTTKYEYLNDISELGLIPKIGERSQSVNDKKQVVFLSKGKISAVLMFFTMKWFYENNSGEKGYECLKTAEESVRYYDKLIAKKQNKKFSLFSRSIDELEKGREEALDMLNQIKNMRRYPTFEDYWGEGVYLSVDNVSNVKYNHPDLHNCWVEDKIAPEDINVVMLKNSETGEMIDDKREIINYFMANIPSEDLMAEYCNTIGINDDRYAVQDTMRKFIKYYSDNDNEFRTLKDKYELIEIPIKEYINLKSTNKSIEM